MDLAVERLSVENYGCIKRAELAPTALHAVVGPNDSGKSTLLRAARTLVHLAAGPLLNVNGQAPFDPLLNEAAATRLELHYGPAKRRTTFGLQRHEGQWLERAVVGDNSEFARSRSLDAPGSLATGASGEASEFLRRRSEGGVVMIRFDPDVLRRPSALLVEGGSLRFADERGAGIAGVIDLVLKRADDSFRALKAEVCALFPTISTFRPRNLDGNRMELEVQLHSGQRVTGAAISDGLLYFLAFAALKYLDRPALFLVEEPENGLHPARIREVMAILRAVSQYTQVLIATHSPLVINELRDDEVTVVTRDEATGTKLTPISATPGFAERRKVYALGELWLTYADGVGETALLAGGPSTP